MGCEVGGGDLEAVEEDAGALEVHLIGSDADEDVGDGFLDPRAVLSVFEREGVVGEDGDALDAVVKAGELVAHGVGAAADAFAVQMNALVRFGRILLKLWMKCHMYPPGGISHVAETVVVAVWYIPKQVRGSKGSRC